MAQVVGPLVLQPELLQSLFLNWSSLTAGSLPCQLVTRLEQLLSVEVAAFKTEKAL